MEHVVYILGAGFSAPLGLPVVANFLTKSKDLFAARPSEFPHFQQVFATIDELAKIKNYFSADLFDVEEILSILEMEEQFGERDLAEVTKRYICDVVKALTPPLLDDTVAKRPANWFQHIFGSSAWSRYGAFVASLHGIVLTQHPVQSANRGGPRFTTTGLAEPRARYSVISLNYDLVLETACLHFKKHYGAVGLAFQRTDAQEGGAPVLAKLHGSADTGNVVPPTWKKALSDNIAEQWKIARQVLGTANHIRVLGYSLPTADAYVKYLLKASAAKASHLKKIDIITLDPKDIARHRYDDFLSFRDYRFANANMDSYLGHVEHPRQVPAAKAGIGYAFDHLELRHESFMATHAG